jgi:hypothetical protein
MARITDNPDRNFSAGPVQDLDPQSLRDLLKNSEVADLFDAVVQRRIGEIVGRAIFGPDKQRW